MSGVIVDVEMAFWELQSGGEPFSVDDVVTWVVYSADRPGLDHRRLVATFNEYTPDDEVSLYEVTGVVRRIVVVRQAEREVPGTFGRTNDPSRESRREVQSADRDDDAAERKTSYEVELEIDPDDLPPERQEVLPALVPDLLQARAEAGRSLLASPAGKALGRFYESFIAATQGRATLVAGSGPLGATFIPRTARGAELRWFVRDGTVTVHAGMGSWRLPLDIAGIAELDRLASAVAAGGIRDGRGIRSRSTHVTAADGEKWSDVEQLPAGTFVRIGGGPDRLRAPARRYAPWR
ncbi:hypothetical protein B5808_14570 [Cnuibacter physcomitrellae]|uniref:Uncharacterized protein n=1 Tax=Cnuibacter physcomitrellae TaxID=1619308 RepID=A0A1X9LPR8_9MICO|nr:hypothetical protein B5808_14570 [Cnuibacter physcomitrellae]